MRTLKTAAICQAANSTSFPPSGRQHKLYRNALAFPSTTSHADQHDPQNPPEHLPGVEHSLAAIPILPGSTLTSEDDQLRTGIRAARSGGFRLAGQPRSILEESFGLTLPNVRLHIDAQSDRLSRSLGAIAFTAGRDIFFRSGMYRPSTREGIGLLAHEAAHVIQQAEEPLPETSTLRGISISDPDDASERDARAVAASIAADPTDQRAAAIRPGRPGRAPLAPAGAGSLIIQRATIAKDPAPAPTTSGQVADLPADVMKRLNAACTKTAGEKERQEALDHIYDYLKAQKLIDNVEKRDFKYSTKASSTYGLATPYTHSDAPKVIIEIFSNAFDKGPAEVYSTIRHELIHAEQYRQQPSGTGKKTTSGDAFFYYYRGANNSVPVGTGYEYAIRGVISEIETHAWEIENSAATSISPAFKKNRVDTLQTLYKQLVDYYGKLTPAKQNKWDAYIQAAKTMAETVLAREVKGFTTKALAASSPTAGKTSGVTKSPSHKEKTKKKVAAARAKRKRKKTS